LYASHWEASPRPFRTYSKMFKIKPASKPPRNRRVRLILPIGILHERSPECRNSKGAEGTVGWSLRGGHGASQGEKRACPPPVLRGRFLRRVLTGSMFFCFISIDERRPSSQGTPT